MRSTQVVRIRYVNFFLTATVHVHVLHVHIHNTETSITCYITGTSTEHKRCTCTSTMKPPSQLWPPCNLWQRLCGLNTEVAVLHKVALLHPVRGGRSY